MRKYSESQAVDIGNRVAGVTITIVSMAVALAIGVILIKVLWVWTIPDLFPAAVDQGLISTELSWLDALKLVGIVAILNSSGALVADRWRR